MARRHSIMHIGTRAQDRTKFFCKKFVKLYGNRWLPPEAKPGLGVLGDGRCDRLQTRETVLTCRWRERSSMRMRVAAPGWSASWAPREATEKSIVQSFWVPLTHSSWAQPSGYACRRAPASGISTQFRASRACRIGNRRARPGFFAPQSQPSV